MNATVTITSFRPCSARSSMMCSMHGLPTIGTIGLGSVRGERAQARPLPAGHHDGLHVRSSRRAVTTYWIPATTARPTPIQKQTSGQRVPSAVSITKKIEA